MQDLRTRSLKAAQGAQASFLAHHGKRKRLKFIRERNEKHNEHNEDSARYKDYYLPSVGGIEKHIAQLCNISRRTMKSKRWYAIAAHLLKSST